jgi:hypothetical protein
MSIQSLHHQIHAILHLQIQNRSVPLLPHHFFESPVLTAGNFTIEIFWHITLAPLYSEDASHRFLQKLWYYLPHQTTQHHIPVDCTVISTQFFYFWPESMAISDLWIMFSIFPRITLKCGENSSYRWVDFWTYTISGCWLADTNTLAAAISLHVRPTSFPCSIPSLYVKSKQKQRINILSCDTFQSLYTVKPLLMVSVRRSGS